MQPVLQPENLGYRKQDGGTKACMKGIFHHRQSVSSNFLTKMPWKRYLSAWFPSPNCLLNWFSAVRKGIEEKNFHVKK